MLGDSSERKLFYQVYFGMLMRLSFLPRLVNPGKDCRKQELIPAFG